MSYGRVDFHRVEPKGAIPIDRDNLSVGKGQRSGDSKGNANAETAESASIQIGSGLQTDAGKAQQIAAIGDRDIVLCDTVADGVENRQRVDIAVCAELRGRGGLAFLIGTVWSQNISRALRVADRIDAGQIFVNVWNTMSVQTPFGGYKNSGYGREKGIEAIHHYSHLKTVTVKI